MRLIKSENSLILITLISCKVHGRFCTWAGDYSLYSFLIQVLGNDTCNDDSQLSFLKTSLDWIFATIFAKYARGFLKYFLIGIILIALCIDSLQASGPFLDCKHRDDWQMAEGSSIFCMPLLPSSEHMDICNADRIAHYMGNIWRMRNSCFPGMFFTISPQSNNTRKKRETTLLNEEK